jgi:hypothetical protein
MKLVLVLVGLLVAVGAYITLAIVDTSAWPAWARPLTAFIGSSGVLTAFWDLIKAHTETRISAGREKRRECLHPKCHIAYATEGFR